MTGSCSSVIFYTYPKVPGSNLFQGSRNFLTLFDLPVVVLEITGKSASNSVAFCSGVV